MGPAGSTAALAAVAAARVKLTPTDEARLETLAPAKLFRNSILGPCPGVRARASYDPGFGLVIAVDALPAEAFNRLAHPGAALFSVEGERIWARIRDTGQRCLEAGLGRETVRRDGLMVAVLLMPSATAALETLRHGRAA